MNAVKINSVSAWFLAARPKTLSAAAVPVAVACALAWGDGVFRLAPAMLCMVFAFIMQINANFINDFYDFKKGGDGDGRLGPKRACAQGWITPKAMRIGIIFATALAAFVGLIILNYGGAPMLFVGLACILFAFLYTTGPYPLAYKGWGDVAVIVFFGIVPVCCTFYVMAGYADIKSLFAGLACGFVCDTLLVVNNFRDFKQDSTVGKRTVVVRFGPKFGSMLYFALGVCACLLCLPFAFMGKPLAFALPLLYLAAHFLTWRKMMRIKEGKALNSVLGDTARNMAAFGILLSVGLAV